MTAAAQSMMKDFLKPEKLQELATRCVSRCCLPWIARMCFFHRFVLRVDCMMMIKRCEWVFSCHGLRVYVVFVLF